MILKKEEQKEEIKKKNKIIISCIGVALAVILILLGIYQFYIANPKRIVSDAITKLSDKADDIFDLNKTNNKLGDSYTINGNIEFDIKSDMLNSLASSEEMKPYVKLLENLNKATYQYTLKQDNKNKKLLFNLDSKLNNKNLINVNYLIQNDKQYFLVKDFLDTYIDGGEIKYFESLEESEDTIKDFEYIYNFTIDSFQKHLKSSYIKKEDTKTKINGKDKDVKKVTLTIDHKNVNEIANGILDDLKKDEKASKILTRYNKDFKDSKIDNATVSEDEAIYFSVYTDKITYQTLKYELTIKDSNDNINIVYHDSKEDTIELFSSDKLIGSAVISEKGDTDTITVKDASNNKLGDIVITVTDTKATLNANFTYQNINVIFNINQDIKEEKDKYDYTTTSEIKILSGNMNMVDANIKMTATATKGTNVTENVDKSVKAENLTTEQQEKLQNGLYGVLTTLMQ